METEERFTLQELLNDEQEVVDKIRECEEMNCEGFIDELEDELLEIRTRIKGYIEGLQ